MGLAKDKHSSLLGPIVSNDEKRLILSAPGHVTVAVAIAGAFNFERLELFRLLVLEPDLIFGSARKNRTDRPSELILFRRRPEISVFV